MATQTQPDQALTGAWLDLTIALAGLISVDATIQNVGSGAVAIVWGADPAAGTMSGLILGPRESASGNAANVYARSLGGSGALSVTLTT